jgi:hypothetical protein
LNCSTAREICVPIFPDPEASFLAKIDRGIGINSEMFDAFDATSTTNHIIAISGFKLSSIDALCRDSMVPSVLGWTDRLCGMDKNWAHSIRPLIAQLKSCSIEQSIQ